MMTCFHYYDHLAEEWLRGTCEDLGMPYVEGLCADNAGMLKPEFRRSIRFFRHEFHEACAARRLVEKKSRVLADIGSPRFTPSSSRASSAGIAEKKRNLRTVLLTDKHKKDGNLSRMIDVFLGACAAS